MHYRISNAVILECSTSITELLGHHGNYYCRQHAKKKTSCSWKLMPNKTGTLYLRISYYYMTLCSNLVIQETHAKQDGTLYLRISYYYMTLCSNLVIQETHAKQDGTLYSTIGALPSSRRFAACEWRSNCLSS